MFRHPFRWLYVLILLSMSLVTSAQPFNMVKENFEKYGRYNSGPNPAQEVEDENRLSLDFVTPHTKWAKPYVRGATRVMIFSHCRRFDTIAREPAELLQRFDITASLCYGDFFKSVEPDYMWLGNAYGEVRMAKLMEQPYDVYLFNHISPQNLPPLMRQKVAAAVAAGAGLVLVGTDDLPASRIRIPKATDPQGLADIELLKPETRLPAVPLALADLAKASAYAIGKGRAVSLPARPRIDYARGWEATYDYWEETVGRAVLWAAHKEPQATLTLTKPASAWSATPTPLTVVWRGAAQGMTLEARVRLEDGRPLSLGTQPVAAAEGKATFLMPALPNGAHHLEAVLRQRNAVASWTVAPLQITAPRKVALTLPKTWGETGDIITGQVTITGEALPNERLTLQLVDARERILQRQPIAEDGHFRFAITDWMPMLLRVEAVLSSDGHEVTNTYAYVNVTQRHQYQFNFVVWGNPRDTASAHLQEATTNLGVTIVLGRENPMLEQAAYNVSWLPYMTKIENRLNKDGVSAVLNKDWGAWNDGCWNDPAFVEKHLTTLTAAYQPARQHGVFAYSLGDEGSTYGSCLHPACLAAYRKFLQNSYGTLAALNDSWGTAYRSFDEVTLLGSTEEAMAAPPDRLAKALIDANNEHAAPLLKNYPRWYDRMAFQRDNLLQFCLRHAEAIKKMDPQALVGFEGTSGGQFDQSADAEGLIQNLDFWGPYPSPTDELIRSIAPRSMIFGNWTGYDKSANGELFDYWRQVTRGCNAVLWWMCTGTREYHGLVAPDMAPYPRTREMLDDTRITRDGLGDLLMRSKRLDDGIAVLFSQPSECATPLGTGSTYGIWQTTDDINYRNYKMYFWNHTADLTNWHQAIWDAGLQFTYITDRMIEKTPIDLQRYRVLILPRAEALSDKAAAAIRTYVAAGGTVIADVRPGLYTEHCKLRATGCLDDLFGITRTEPLAAVRADLQVAGTLNGQSLALAFSVKEAQSLNGMPDALKKGGGDYGPRVDPSVAVTTGTAYGSAGKTPLCIIRTVGKGRAILLNFALAGCFMPFDSWPDPQKHIYSETPEPLADFIGNLLAMAGVIPQVRLTDAAGHRVRNVEIIRWQNGNQQILTFFRKCGEKGPAHVVLPDAGSLYDLRSGKDMGKVRQFDTELLPLRPSWFAVLPKPAPPITLTLDAKQVAPGQVLHAMLSVPGASGKHAFHLRLTGPGNPDAHWIRRIVVTDGTPVQITIPIALNDPAGAWTLEATDVLGRKTTVDFLLR